MAFSKEIYELVQRYAKDKHNRDVDMQTLISTPWHKIVATWWDAQVFYGVNHFYSDLDEAPKVEGVTVRIRTREGVSNYEYYRGEWKITGELTESMFKN